MLSYQTFDEAGLARSIDLVMQDSWNALLLEFHQHQIVTHPSYTYGEGFRGAYAACLRNDLQSVVQSVCDHGQLPDI
jgi:hypothetical protein